jgi:hypothetical protein
MEFFFKNYAKLVETIGNTELRIEKYKLNTTRCLLNKEIRLKINSGNIL